MREIKFRGQRVDTKQWVCGCYFWTPLTEENSGVSPDKGWFLLSDGEIRHCIGIAGVAFVVAPETVGQFTGLKDKNGVEIYEGDIVEMTHWNPSRWVVAYSDDNGAFYFRHKVEQPYDTCHPMRYLERATVVGNVHENPEFLTANPAA